MEDLKFNELNNKLQKLAEKYPEHKEEIMNIGHGNLGNIPSGSISISTSLTGEILKEATKIITEYYQD